MVSSQAVMTADFTEDFKELVEAGAGLSELRKRAFAAYSDKGFPVVKNEEWKYTNVAPIAKEKWTVAQVSAKGEPLDESFETLAAKFNYDRNGFTALNMALSEFICIRIPKENGGR